VRAGHISGFRNSRVGAPARRRAGLRRTASYVLLLALLLPASIVVATYPRYRAAMQFGSEGLTGSDLTATPFGDVEYVDQGTGPTVVLVHGAGGGYDQGLLIGRTFVGEGYRFIAPSRFGYLRSSIPRDGSPAAQADAYAALLDSLGVGRVAVVAFSDGGPSALQFALRHPDRTAALVMMSAKSQTPSPTSPLQEAVFETIFRSDYLYWAVSEAARPFLLEMLGVSAAVQDRATVDGQRLITAATDGMNPISLRRDGIYHDRATLGVLPEDVFQLEQIAAPTLVVHAKDDGLQPYGHGQNTAARVPGVQLVSYERGGHLLSLQIDDAREKVTAFVAQHTAGPASNR
jgi:2-hydroxy-6-oxonona-2,4-dienedioate hydrolase